MNYFTFKPIYLEGQRRVLEVNILPEKHCNFDCIFCPLGRGAQAEDEPLNFKNTEESLHVFSEMLVQEQPDLVFINSKGESLLNNQLAVCVDHIHQAGIPVRLLSNGYLFGDEFYGAIAKTCEEVIGELKVVSDSDFQKIQRPVHGYTFEKHLEHLQKFRQDYLGVFILEITVIKGYSDSELAIQRFSNIIQNLRPDRLLIERIVGDPFEKKLGVEDERFKEICIQLQNAYSKS